MGGVGTFGVVACVQEVAVTPGELLADADLIHYTLGASEKDEEEEGLLMRSSCFQPSFICPAGRVGRGSGQYTRVQLVCSSPLFEV